MNIESGQTAEVAQNYSGIHFGHLGIVMLCAIVLIFTAWMKSGFNFILSPGSEPITKILTYDQAMAQVLAEAGESPQSSIADGSGSNSNQLAMIDPMLSDVAVLGTSTGTLDTVIPSGDQVLTPEILNNIKVTVIATTSLEAIKKYKDDLEFVENQDGAASIIADLTSQDSALLKTDADKITQLLVDLLQVEVPAPLADYHKVTLLYYTELRELALGYSGDVNARDPKDVGLEIFPITDYLENAKSNLLSKYGLQF